MTQGNTSLYERINAGTAPNALFYIQVEVWGALPVESGGEASANCEALSARKSIRKLDMRSVERGICPIPALYVLRL